MQSRRADAGRPRVSRHARRHVLGLLTAAILATTISGIGGTAGFLYFHNSTAPILSTWQHWFASDALGILTVAPLIIELAATGREPPSRTELIEGITALVALAGASAAVILLPQGHWGIVVPIALLFPLLLWLAARCRPIFAATAAFIIAFALVWMTTFDIGYFGESFLSIEQRILGAQASILAISLCALVLASLFAERRHHEAALFEGQARLQEALTAGGVVAFEWDALTTASQRSDNAAQILGFDPNQNFSASEFLARVHPDDRGQFKSLIHSVSPERPSYKMTFRFGGPNGREIWLEESSRAEFDATGRCVRLKGLTVDITERKLSEERQGMPMNNRPSTSATTKRPPSLSITLLATSARAIPIETTVAAMSVEAAKARLVTSSASATVRCSLPSLP